MILIITFIVYFQSANSEATDKDKTNCILRVKVKLNHSPKELEDALKKWEDKLNSRTLPTEVEDNYFSYRLSQDHILLNNFLESEGYYQAKIQSSFDINNNQENFIVNITEAYLFGEVKILTQGVAKNKIIVPDIKNLNAKTNQIAKTSNVLKDEELVEKWIEKNNCLFEYKIIHQAILNHITKRVNITYYVTYSMDASFGDITFSGSNTIDELYLTSLLPIKKGECFKRSELNSAKSALRKSNLIDKIEVKLPVSPDLDGLVPVEFSVTDKPPHTVKFGASYSTDLGAGISAGWEHRNIMSHGESLYTSLSITEIERKFETDLVKPFFIRSDQKLKLSSYISKENNDAYRSTGLGISGRVERDLGNKWLVGVGTKYNFEHVIDQDNDEKIMLISLPIFASQDRRDNILDPQNGWTLNFINSPGFDTIDIKTSFVKNYAIGSYYIPLSNSNSVLALKTSLGSITGASSTTIPATERFYAGGASSIRGYGYQMVGPLDNDQKPMGGRSLIEISSELRFRISDDYGAVTFMDCGNSFKSKFPEISYKLLCGAGIGLRYYTLFGPLRIDAARPLNKRSGIDDSFQLYFSIGQAF